MREQSQTDTSARRALFRGWRRRCPNCGSGQVFRGYLAVAEHCTVCREPLAKYKADDGPAYLTILLVGHLMAPLLHVVFVAFRPDPLVLFTIFAVGCVALSLYLLPKFKGAIIGYKWARRDHEPDETDPMQRGRNERDRQDAGAQRVHNRGSA